MNPWTTFGVLLVLLFGVAGVALTAGLWAGARVVQSASPSDPSSTRARTVARTPQRTTTAGGTAYHPATEDEEWTGPPNPGPDPSGDARREVRQAERDAIRRSNPGFRGRDLSDREVERWLRRWNL